VSVSIISGVFEWETEQGIKAKAQLAAMIEDGISDMVLVLYLLRNATFLSMQAYNQGISAIRAPSMP